MGNVPLSTKTCVPCKAGAPKLSPKMAQVLMRQLSPKWKLKGNSGSSIERVFQFKNFRESMHFVNQVAEIAEQEGHHPDIHIHYSEVRLELYTHKVGGLHENDFILAAKIDKLPEALP